MIKNINQLSRFDFTGNCRTCKFKQELGMLEYCCSFVIDMLEKIGLQNIKMNIASFVVEGTDIEKLDLANLFFDKDEEYVVTLTFKSNLREDKELILKELQKTLCNSIYFTDVVSVKNTLYKYSDEESHMVE